MNAEKFIESKGINPDSITAYWFPENPKNPHRDDEEINIIELMEAYHKYKISKEEEEEHLSCCGDILDPDFMICPTCL